MIKNFYFLLFLTLFSTNILSKEFWEGTWVATDEWQSEYTVIIEKDGRALSSYGDGEEGTWMIRDGNLLIEWESGNTDYWFNGVMGFQRIFKSKRKSYTSGIKKQLLNNP